MKNRIIFQGREYDGTDQMPENVRREYEECVKRLRPAPRPEANSPARDGLAETPGEPGIRFLGETYPSVDSMPQDIRDFYEEVRRDLDGDGVPDFFQRRSDRETSYSYVVPERERNVEKKDVLSDARKREKAYFSLSVVFLVLSPFAVWGLSQADPEPLLIFDTLCLVVALAGLVVTGLVELMIEPRTGDSIWSRVWIRDPTARSVNEVRLDREDLMEEITTRLRVAGLSLVSPDGASDTHRRGLQGRTRVLEFEGNPVYVNPWKPLELGRNFVNYRASGSLRIEPVGREFLIHGEITRPGILPIDTGQRRRLRSVIDYLTLRTEGPEYQEISFFIIYGLCLVYASILAGILSLLDPSMWGSISVRASVIGAFGLVTGRLVQPYLGRSVGNKLAYIGLALAAVIWLRPVSGLFP